MGAHKKLKIAVVGAGLSGLQAALALKHFGYDVTVFESNDRVGGHFETIRVPFWDEGIKHEAVVDMGVFMFDPQLIHPYLGSFVSSKGFAKTEIPLNFTLEQKNFYESQLCWTTQGFQNAAFKNARILARALRKHIKLNGLISGSKKIVHYVQAAMEIERFNHMLDHIVSDNRFKFLSVGDFVTKYKFTDLLLDNLIVPQMLCWWGSSRTVILNNSIQVFADSLHKVHQKPQYTLMQGMYEIISSLCKPIEDNILTSTHVTKLQIKDEGVDVFAENTVKHFDAIILATPPSVTQNLIGALDYELCAVLDRFTTIETKVYLHTDIHWMPRYERWTTINSISDDRGTYCTFWVGKLNSLSPHIFLTWGDKLTEVPEKSKTIKVSNYLRTLPTVDYVHASHEIQKYQGKHHLWFCGAHVHALDGINSLWADNALMSGIRAAESVHAALKNSSENFHFEKEG